MTIRHFLRLRHEAIYAAQILLGNSRKSYSYDATVRSNDMRIYSASAGEAIQIALFMSKIMSPTKFEVSKTLGFRENRRHGTDGQTGGRAGCNAKRPPIDDWIITDKINQNIIPTRKTLHWQPSMSTVHINRFSLAGTVTYEFQRITLSMK